MSGGRKTNNPETAENARPAAGSYAQKPAASQLFLPAPPGEGLGGQMPASGQLPCRGLSPALPGVQPLIQDQNLDFQKSFWGPNFSQILADLAGLATAPRQNSQK